jgi:hypothetical protein
MHSPRAGGESDQKAPVYRNGMAQGLTRIAWPVRGDTCLANQLTYGKLPKPSRDAARMIGAAGLEVAAAASVPLFAFIINWRERSRHGYALSAAADFALALAAFDLVALIYSNVFAEVMRNEVFKHGFNRVILPLFLLTLVTWICLFLRLEHKMAEGYDFHRRRYIAARPMGAFLAGGSLLAFFLAMHILAFVYE